MDQERKFERTRSFGIVENKLFETEFFLRKIAECDNPSEAMFYLSAFVTAGRSVTFALKASLSKVSGFESWYKKYEEKLKINDLAGYFVEARNESQKLGIFHISGWHFFRNKNGVQQIKYFFKTLEKNGVCTPEDDVVSCCNRYFLMLLEIAYDCFQEFGSLIDSEQYFTIENMFTLGKKIEDFEEELGFPRGWTKGIPDSERMRLLRNESSKTDIDTLFISYLQKNRFGKKIIEPSSDES